MFGSASAPPFGLRSSRTEHLHHQRPRGWAKTNRRSGPSQVAKLTVISTAGGGPLRDFLVGGGTFAIG